jgi:nicotinic acetylcholine receptor, invertebrate
MVFASWSYDGFGVDVDINSIEGDTTNYMNNGEWHLVKLEAARNVKIYSCCEEPFPEIIYTIVIRRRPLYYVFNMVFPCLLITLVAFLGFYLPPGSTEKVNIGITTLLSVTVFLMLVAESMPPTSEQIPLLGIYYFATISIVSFSTSLAVITLNINNKGRDGQEVPRILKIIFFKYLIKIFPILRSDKKKFKEHRSRRTKTKYSVANAINNNNNKNSSSNSINNLKVQFNNNKYTTTKPLPNELININDWDNSK